MYALISPAKRLDLTRSGEGLPATAPSLSADTRSLVERCQTLTPADLGQLMKISEKLAELNFERFQSFDTAATAKGTPAGLTFAGDTYLGLEAESFEPDDWAFAQSSLGILSGLYGVLRPLDRIQPYRLEMGTRLETARGKDLYAFWGSRVVDAINERTQGHVDRRVINLASKEYIKVVDPRRLEGGGVTITFKEEREGKLRVIGLFAKQARGAMARFVVRERLERAEELHGFTERGYRYRADLSTEVEWVFTRPQPPPVGKK